MEPSKLLLWIKADLEPWIKARHGYLSIAGDPGMVLEQLADAPKSFRVTMCWAGDDPQDDIEESGIVTNHFEFWLSKPKGLKLIPGESLIKPSGPDDPAYLQLLSDLRARLRSIGFPPHPTTYGRMMYRGAKPYPSPELAFELPTTGFCLRFDLIGAVPHIPLRGTSNADGGV
jgi:hypothetical protein